MERRWLQHYPPEVPHALEYPKALLTDFLCKAAEEFPEKIAIRFLGKSITYRQLQEEVYRFANALKDLGVQKGERVSIMLPNCPQAVIAYYAALWLGAIVVQTNPMYVERELLYQLKDAEASTIICLDLFYDKVKKVAPETALERIIVTSIKDYLPFPKKQLYALTQRVKIDPDEKTYFFIDIMKKALPEKRANAVQDPEEIALVQYTGGTTGVAKGAMLSHRNLVVNTCQAAAWFYKIQRGEGKILGVLPFFHVYGMTTVMNFGIYTASTMILLPKFDRKMVLKTIHKERPNLFPGAPTMYVALMHHPHIHRYDLSSIEACISGSAPLPVEVQEQFEKLIGGRLIEGYGLTEASPVTHANLIWDRKKHATIGLPWPDTDCRIVDVKTGEVLEVGQVGELQVKGPQVMKGYWRRPDETKEVLKDGWLFTGDIAMMDEEGYFYIKDRKKDVIIVGGYNVYPREVEEVLYEHPAILEAAVIGVADDFRGEVVKAYVVVKEGKQVTAEELEAFCRERLSLYKVPRLFEFRQELPKSMIGKVLRRVLKEEANQAKE